MFSYKKDPVLIEYSKLAPQYDRRWSFYIEASIQQTLRRFRVSPGDHVLDIGCGTGALLKALSAAVPQAQLAGIDPSPEMLELAQAKLGTYAEIKQAQAEHLPFNDGVFDFAISTNVFRFIRQPRSALQEMYRVLRPEGTVVITDWCRDYLTCKLYDLFLRVFNRAHSVAYSQKQCQTILEKSDFECIQIDRYKINWLWGLMTAVATKCSAQ